MPVLTTETLRQQIRERFGINVPTWRLRRTIDGMGDVASRIGGYRIIALEAIDRIASELRRQNWLPPAGTSPAGFSTPKRGGARRRPGTSKKATV